MRFSKLGTRLLFEVLRAAYERMSLVVTTKSRWGSEVRYLRVNPSQGAAADRLTDSGHLLEATGDPYWKPGRKTVVIPRFRTS